MMTRLEKLGDRLLSLIVPHARASCADCFCEYAGDCDRVRIRWFCHEGGNGHTYFKCATLNPCG
jgi:hypothetical protein